jgi:hypothetical protein
MIFLRDQISFDILSSRDVMKESGIIDQHEASTRPHHVTAPLALLVIARTYQTKVLKFSHRKADRRVCEISNDLVGFLFIPACRYSSR